MNSVNNWTLVKGFPITLITIKKKAQNGESNNKKELPYACTGV